MKIHMIATTNGPTFAHKKCVDEDGNPVLRLLSADVVRPIQILRTYENAKKACSGFPAICYLCLKRIGGR